MKTTKAKVKVINPITSETIPPEEFSKISHFETILEVTGTPKNISLGVKEIADRLINERTRISKSKDKFLLFNVLLRKEVWQLVCGVGNINFQGDYKMTLFRFIDL